VRAPQQFAVNQRRRSQVADEQQHLAPLTVGIQATPWLRENGGERFPFLTPYRRRCRQQRLEDAVGVATSRAKIDHARIACIGATQSALFTKIIALNCSPRGDEFID